MLLLVRHAHAGDKANWDGPDHLRLLSPSGRAEAEGLVIRLDGYPIERMLSSPALRCRQTLEPLARDRRLPIEPAGALDRDAVLDELLALVHSPELRNTVLCTHGEAFGRLLPLLVADGLAVAAPLQWPKGCTWLLERVGGRPARARYLPPLARTDPALAR
jgi:8-oxo-dGTP diphosphatase